MTIREVLQHELWSKETTRRILSRAKRPLAWIAIAVCSIAIVAGALDLIEVKWLTAGERQAGRNALGSVDALSRSSGGTDEEFDSKLVEANLDEIKTNRESRQMRTTWLQELIDKGDAQSLALLKKEIEWNSKSDSTDHDLEMALSSLLHKILD